MAYTDVLRLVGGLCLFLFGMQIMGNALEKRAGSKLSGLIARLTGNRLAGFLTGLGVTAVIQSSSATTVMVVGFVNSGMMDLRQAIHVIMGANVGTTVTAWILSLSGISSENPLIAMLKPDAFTPILALLGIVLLFCRSEKRKDTGTILLGFATLMFGMSAMSASVSGLKAVPEFRNVLLAFSNPVLGVLAGALLTAVLQSSSASVGILQALASTGQVTIGASIPVVLGQNIGTCITALLSSVGTNKNARRAALVHLSFNVLGCVFWLAVYSLLDRVFLFSFAQQSANESSIALIHSIFNVACSVCMLPLTGLLEKLAYRLIPEGGLAELPVPLLDERLLATPAFAMERCRALSLEMARCAQESVIYSMALLEGYDPDTAAHIRALETETDRYEDQLGAYLVKLSTHALSENDSREVSRILHVIGDLERIADHAVNLTESAEEIRSKDLRFSEAAQTELQVLLRAVEEITDLACTAYQTEDLLLAARVEPLEQVIDGLKEQIRSRHILRLQAGGCSLHLGFVLSDLLTDLERMADHCSNIAGCLLEMPHIGLAMQEDLRRNREGDGAFRQEYQFQQQKYSLP